MNKNRREPLVILFCILAVVNIFWFGHLAINHATDDKTNEDDTVVEDTEGTEDTEDTEGTKDTEGTEDTEDTEEAEDAEEAEDTEDTEDTENIENTDVYTFYYDQLQADEKNWYDALYKGLLERNNNIVIEDCEGSSLMKIWLAITLDHPEIFWVSSYRYLERTLETTTCEVMPEYVYTKEEISKRQDEIGKFTEEFVEGISSNASDYEKILYTYETLVEHCEYELNAPNNQHIDSVIIGQRTVCGGYAKTTKYLLDQLGVEAIYVMGMADNGTGPDLHAWNIVKCEDDYYYVDTTWGDPAYQPGSQKVLEINYDYLCCNEEQLSVTHEMTTEYNYDYEFPACTSLEWNYYVVNGRYFTEYNADAISALIKKDIEDNRKVSEFRFSDSSVYQETKTKLLDVHLDEGRAWYKEKHGSDANISYIDGEERNFLIILWQ